MKIYAPLLLLFLLFSCQQEEQTTFFLDEDLQEYFVLFSNEAIERGYEIDPSLNQISGIIESINSDNVIGNCQYNEANSGIITIDSDFWQNATTLEKEIVVFHELGHCYLKREHLNDATSNGFCTSIMTSGGDYCVVRYNFQTRSDYLDELFLTE